MLRRWLCVWVVLLVAFALPDAVDAKKRRSKPRVQRRVAVPLIPARIAVPDYPPDGPYASALLADADSGRVLYAKALFEARPPASMVKMMTALVTFEALDRGEVRLDQKVLISREASRTGGSGVALRAGEVLTLDDLLRAMMVASANGASVAIAETVAGSTEAMIARMNQRARELGLNETVYRTVNGLPPRRGRGLADVSSANDLAIVARKLLDHTDVFHYSSHPVVPIRNGTVLLRNTNHLVGRMDGADGLKTGYYRQAGFNLTATATRGGMRLIAVVLGCPTLYTRFAVAQQLLEWGFGHFSKLTLVEAGQPISLEVQVANGATDHLRPVAREGLTYVVRNDQKQDLHVIFQVPSVVSAPIAKDQELGEIIIRDQEQILDVIPAVSPVDIVSFPAAAANP
ncbi:MAG: D-alanyl-D-alanine carboxypeptidase family protein [Candidatus Binatia bacterium]